MRNGAEMEATGTLNTAIASCPTTKHGISQLIQILLLLHLVMDRAFVPNHLESL
jgi:hypothetical protein